MSLEMLGSLETEKSLVTQGLLELQGWLVTQWSLVSQGFNRVYNVCWEHTRVEVTGDTGATGVHKGRGVTRSTGLLKA